MDKMMSLFDYLGRAAGTDLGKRVYLAARAKGASFSQREVSTKSYTGMVMLYPESFLKEYFDSKPSDDLDGDNLPFVDDTDEDLPF